MLRKLLASGAGDKIVFTVTPTDSSRVLTLQDFTAPYAAVVNWGDGNSDKITSNTALSHTYADNTPCQVVIRGKLGGFWNSTTRAAGTNIVTSVDEVCSESLVSFGETFRQCTSLRTLPTTIKAENVSNFTRTFYQCDRIESALPALWTTNASASHSNCFTQCFLNNYGKFGTNCSNREYIDAVVAQTFYQKYGTSCSAATYRAAVSRQTYYQKYGTSCSYRSYVAAVSRQTYYEKYGTSCSNRKYVVVGYKTMLDVLNGSCPHKRTTNNGRDTVCDYSGGDCPYPSCKVKIDVFAYECKVAGSGSRCSSSCNVTYRAAEPAYYKCTGTGSGVAKCSSSCNKTYRAAQSAYYSCGQSGSSGTSKCTSSCKRTYTAAQSAYYKCTKDNTTCDTTDCEYPYANELDVTAARNAGWA